VTMTRLVQDYVKDMLEAMKKAQSFIKNMGFNDFAEDSKT